MSADLELCYLSGVQALEQYRARTLSPVELVSALIERIEAVEPKINAFTYTFFDRALAQAHEAERRYAGDGRCRRLEGLPIVIKDFHDLKGEITTYGSRLFEHHRPKKSLAYVDRLLKAGAIVIARSTTPEFAHLAVTQSDLWGVTRNPWNLDMTPGGSSGGAGAALAAGMTTLADGSDIGGSIRIPASFSGVFGIKPSHGRVPTGGALGLDPFLAYGPLTRTVGESALMMNVMAGAHRNDPLAVPGRLRLPLDPSGIKGWKIALSMDLGYFDIDKEIVANTLAAADALREAGAIVEEVDIGWSDEALKAGAAHYVVFSGCDHPDPMTADQRALLSDATRDHRAYMRETPRQHFDESERYRAKMYADMAKIFRRYKVLITPSIAVASVPADLPVTGAEIVINGKKTDPVWSRCLTYPFNMLGHLPSASAPSGPTSMGVPSGLQVVGRSFDEASVLRVSAALERVKPWLDCPERRPVI